MINLYRQYTTPAGLNQDNIYFELLSVSPTDPVGKACMLYFKTKDPRYISVMAKNTSRTIKILCNKKRRIKELEPTFLREVPMSDLLGYAMDVIKGKWPEFETLLLSYKDDDAPFYATQYAIYVLKARFLAGEEVISRSILKSTVSDYNNHFNTNL